MAITRYDPFRDLANLQDRLLRTFESTLGSKDTEPRELTTLSNLETWTPAVDVFEDEHAITLKVELPEVDLKDIDVRVDGLQLTIKGERRLEREDKRENYHRIERTYGAFMRSFTMPDTVDAEHIRAESNNGILRLNLPKKVVTKPRTIKVDVAGTLPKGTKA